MKNDDIKFEVKFMFESEQKPVKSVKSRSSTSSSSGSIESNQDQDSRMTRNNQDPKIKINLEGKSEAIEVSELVRKNKEDKNLYHLVASHHELLSDRAKENLNTRAYLHGPGAETGPRNESPSPPSSQCERTGAAVWASSSRAWAASTSLSAPSDCDLGSKGVSGGTGSYFRGLNIGTLYGEGPRDCAANCYGTLVPPGGVKTTTGRCNWDLQANGTLRNFDNPEDLMGLATPDARPSASSRGNNIHQIIPPTENEDQNA